MTDLTQRLIAQAQRFAASGAEPAAPRLAATVVLLRPAAPGFEVYLVRRSASMAFASGMYAFPGGAVEPDDFEWPALAVDWSGRLGRPRPEAEAVVRAAVREMTEETGVRVAPDNLTPWTRWITPEFEPRRFDAYFFVTALPDGQDPQEISGEADHTEWLAPQQALDRLAAGEIAMLPPTSVTLGDLAGHDAVESVLAAAAARDAATPVVPRIEQDADGTARLVM